MEVEILPRAQNAVEVAHPGGERHEPGEILQLEVVADGGRETLLAGTGDELAGLDDPLLLFIREFALGVVGLVVGVPIVAQVTKKVRRHRLQKRSVGGSKVLLDEVLAHVLHQVVEPEILPVVQIRHADEHLRVSGPWGGNPAVAEQPVGDGLVHVARVAHRIVKVDLGHSAQFLPLHELVHVDLHGALQPLAGTEEGSVALVADTHFLESMRSEFQIGLGIRELNAECGGDAVAAALRSLEETPVPAPLGTWALHRLHRLPLPGGERQVDVPDLGGIEDFLRARDGAIG